MADPAGLETGVVSRYQPMPRNRRVFAFQRGITQGNRPSREWLQSQADRDRYDDTTTCILCAARTTSCPRGIEIPPAIAEVKQTLLYRRVWDTR